MLEVIKNNRVLICEVLIINIISMLVIIGVPYSKEISRLNKIGYSLSSSINIYKNDNYYIKSNNRIYLFDDKGDIVRIINRHGVGPEEYNYFWMMAVSDKGHISLIQRGEFSIITYNSYGNFISRLKLDTIKARDLKYLNDSILITKSDFERNGNKYHVINMNNSTIENSLYPISYREHRIAMKDCMTSYQGKILTCDYHSNEIHEITKDSVSIKYIFTNH